MKPLLFSSLFERAETLETQGRPEDALVLYLRLLQDTPGHYPSLAKACNLLMAQRRYAEARPLLLRALELAPQETELLYNLANADLRLKDAAGARGWAEQALSAKPDFLQARLLLARAHDLLGEQQVAMAEYRKVLAVDPSHAKATFGLGRTAAHAGELELAEQHLRHSLELRLLQASVQGSKPSSASVDEQPSVSTTIGADPEAAEDLLWRTLAALFKLGFHVFPGSGTQLGLHRDGALLQWDKDIDLGLPLSEFSQVCAWFLDQGCDEHSNVMRLVNKRAFSPPGSGLVFDLTGFAQENATGQWLGGFWQLGQRLDWQRVTECPPLRLRKAGSPAGPVWMLAEPEVWLQAVYGDEWRTPDPHWDSAVAARNLRGFAPLTRCYGYIRLWRAWNEQRFEKALSLSQHCQRHLPNDRLLADLGEYFKRQHEPAKPGPDHT